MSLLSAAGIRTDVGEAERRIVAATGADPRPWFRCPFGDGEDSAEVQNAVAESGYRIVPWNLDSGDWRDEATPDAVRDVVTDGARDGSVVLFHTWPRATAGALPAILDVLGRAASFVTVEEVMHGA
jgi:peptidoglycan/xylan/chitin deacetylase (PgdA/CDA1 family)